MVLSDLVRRLPTRQQLENYAYLMRLHRPIGIFLLLWPALWGLWIAAEGSPDWGIVFIFVVGVVLMRSAGCAINDYADRTFDGLVARTKERPLVAGLVSEKEAVGVFLVLILIAFLLVLLLNWQTVALSVVALILATAYPFMKRFTHLPQLVLGMAFGWAIPMAFMAIQAALPPIAWLLYIAAVIWALVYDTQYAMVDREDDLQIGVKSTAILFGEYDRLMIGLLQASVIGVLVIVGVKADLGGYFYFGLFVATLLALYQQWLIRYRDPAGCFAAFINNNYFGLAVFAGVWLDYLFAG